MAETQTAEGTTAQASGGTRRLREYETIIVLRSETTDEQVERLKERLRSLVNEDEGKVLKFTHWGKKKTAFPIANQPRAVYLHANFLAKPGLVKELERNLAIADDVEKYMTTLLAREVDPDTREVQADEKLTGDADERPRTEREGGEQRAEAAGEKAPEKAPEAAPATAEQPAAAETKA